MKQADSFFSWRSITDIGMQVIAAALCGMFVGILFSVIVAPTASWGGGLQGMMGGAVIGLLLALGRRRLWTQIASVNSIIMIATFAALFLILPIDFAVPTQLIWSLLIAVYGMAIVASFLVTRPLHHLVEAIQAIGARELSERVPEKGAWEVRTLAQSFNEMAEALDAAETRRQQLLADVSHELRTPLTVLQSNLRGMLDEVVEPDKEQLAALYTQSRQLNHLVSDLHDLTQADADQLSLNKTELDLNTLIAQAGELFTPLAEEVGVALNTSLPQEAVIVYGDRNRLIQVLQNLLGNGIRHARTRVDLRLRTEGGMACVEIVDNGDGIAAENLPHIFNRFYRIDKSRSLALGGSGLGLAIARAIVQAHGGMITAKSAGLGHGTAVCFALP